MLKGLGEGNRHTIDHLALAKALIEKVNAILDGLEHSRRSVKLSLDAMSASNLSANSYNHGKRTANETSRLPQEWGEKRKTDIPCHSHKTRNIEGFPINHHLAGFGQSLQSLPRFCNGAKMDICGRPGGYWEGFTAFAGRRRC